MSWCMDCGAVGKPERATTTADGDPVCNGCARARGAEPPAFDAEFIEKRMTQHKAGIMTPSAPKEKVMDKKLCACGCGADMEGSPWNFKRGHKPKGAVAPGGGAFCAA